MITGMRSLVVLIAMTGMAHADGEPQVLVDVGANVRQFAGDGASATARTTMPESPRNSAGLFDIHIAVDTSHAFYVALDNELGGLDGEPGTEVIESAGAVGVRVPFGAGAIASELAGGARVFVYDSPTVMPRSDGGFVAVLELRVRGELAVTPWLNAGAAVGTSLVDRGDWIGGLFLGLHNPNR
jgi:hypothetical protein